MSRAGAGGTVKELQDLRKGRGLVADDLCARVGPRLRALCALTEADSAASVRRAVVLKITELCEELDDDRKLPARVAFGLSAQAPGSTLEDRIAWLAAYLDRDPKTAIRRVDSAFRMLAEMIDETGREAASPFAPAGWYNHTVRSTLFMDRPVPLLREERRVIATADGFTDVVVYFSAPERPGFEGPHRISARISYGGEIVAEEQAAPGYTKVTIRLAKVLDLGEAHDFGVEVTAHPREWMQPYLELAPLVPCAHFYLRAKFDPGLGPAKVWRLDGVPRFATLDFMHVGHRLEVDRLGEVVADFHGLKPNLSYGIRW